MLMQRLRLMLSVIPRLAIMDIVHIWDIQSMMGVWSNRDIEVMGVMGVLGVMGVMRVMAVMGVLGVMGVQVAKSGNFCSH